MAIPRLGTLVAIPATAVWGHEAHGFTPWLAANLSLLSEALQLDELELQGTEISTGDFRLDILAEDSFGNPVIIENQFGATDHRHLGQLIAYVASRSQPTTTIWVAEKFKDDHRAAIDWLNASTTEQFNFFAVELEALRIGDSDPAPFFNVVAKPNSWTKASKIGQGSETQQARHAKRLVFWQSFQDFLKHSQSRFNIRTPSRNPYAIFRLGRSGLHLATAITPQKKAVRVELYIPYDANKAAISALLLDRAEIEAIVGEPLSWESLEGNRPSRIALYLDGVDAFDTEQWPAIQHWMLSKLNLFWDAFSGRVQHIPLTAERDPEGFGENE